jgi:hypothetical protein
LPFSNIFSMLKRKRTEQETEALKNTAIRKIHGGHTPSRTLIGQRRTHEKGIASG